MSNTHLDADFNGEVFRKDHPIILATNRHLATLLPVRMAYVSADGYVAGTVIARDPADGFYRAYNDGGASGVATAHAVLFEDVTPASGSSMLAKGIFGGEVFQTKLTGYDAAAGVDLGARSITDALGDQILKF